MNYKVLIPVKALDEAKSRLAPYLTLREREALVLMMLQHVLHVLQSSNQLERISVVSPDFQVLEQAERWGAQALEEEQHGHNPALQAAATRELVTGATGLLTISADLPMLRPADIERMIEESMYCDVVLAPSQEGTGTNAILVRPPLALPYVFGPNSLQRYREEAAYRHLRTKLCRSPGLSFDVDTIDDLERYEEYEREQQTANAAYSL